jgi:hypothetical protein
MPDPGVPLDHLKELLSGLDPDQLRQIMPLDGIITMMFTDIVDSTRVKHEVGDPTYFAALLSQDTAQGLHRRSQRFTKRARPRPDPRSVLRMRFEPERERLLQPGGRQANRVAIDHGQQSLQRQSHGRRLAGIGMARFRRGHAFDGQHTLRLDDDT